MLDTVFGPECFRNEIIWRRTGSHGKVRRFGPIHDMILYYTKTDTGLDKWNPVAKPYKRGHVDRPSSQGRPRLADQLLRQRSDRIAAPGVASRKAVARHRPDREGPPLGDPAA